MRPSKAQERVFVIGVGMTKFYKSAPPNEDYDTLGAAACREALKDCNVPYSAIEAAVCGYVYGDSTCGQRTVYHLGLSGIPIVNVNNNCSTGSTSLFVSRSLLQSSSYSCVLAVGFEKMLKGNLEQRFSNSHAAPTEKHFEHMFSLGADSKKSNEKMNDFTENILKMFAYAQSEHMSKYGSTDDDYSFIAYKNHKHSIGNEKASMNYLFKLEDIKSSPYLFKPIRTMQACPTATGAAAAILCNETFLAANPHLQIQAVEILGQSLVTDLASSFSLSSSSSSFKSSPAAVCHSDPGPYLCLAGYSLAKKAASAAFAAAGLSPCDIDVAEVHDCFAANELFMLEALGFVAQGEGQLAVRAGQWRKNAQGFEHFYYTHDTVTAHKSKVEGSGQAKGRGVVINPSGGLESKGHPLAASGLAQCYELVLQLRGRCGNRQIPGVQTALQHNFGLGSACIVTIYRTLKHSDKQIFVAKL